MLALLATEAVSVPLSVIVSVVGALVAVGVSAGGAFASLRWLEKWGDKLDTKLEGLSADVRKLSERQAVTETTLSLADKRKAATK